MPDCMNYVPWCLRGFLFWQLLQLSPGPSGMILLTSWTLGGGKVICVSPNQPNIYYEVCPRTTVEAGMEHLVTCLRVHGSKDDTVIVYCRSLDMCADFFEHFHNSLGEMSYYPAGSKQLSDNGLFGMYHSNTPPGSHTSEHAEGRWGCSCSICNHGFGHGC